MSINENFYEKLPDEEKVIFDEFCKFQNLVPTSKQAFAWWFEFKKSGLTW